MGDIAISPIMGDSYLAYNGWHSDPAYNSCNSGNVQRFFGGFVYFIQFYPKMGHTVIWDVQYGAKYDVAYYTMRHVILCGLLHNAAYYTMQLKIRCGALYDAVLNTMRRIRVRCMTQPWLQPNPVLISILVCSYKGKRNPAYWLPFIFLRLRIYIRCMYSVFGRKITKFTVIYGEYLRIWPTLRIFMQILLPFHFVVIPLVPHSQASTCHQGNAYMFPIVFCIFFCCHSLTCTLNNTLHVPSITCTLNYTLHVSWSFLRPLPLAWNRRGVFSDFPAGWL